MKFTRVLFKIVPKNIKGKSTNEQRWLKRQLNDRYVKQSKTDYYRCRSAYKLIEIDDKHRILEPGFSVVDCGASPGSWSQVAVKKVNADGSIPNAKIGQVIGIDLKSIEKIKGATFFSCSDFTEAVVQQKVLKTLNCGKADVVLSDMAPNSSGVRSLDHENIMVLCESVVKFSINVLNDGGHFLVKILQGEKQDLLLRGLKTCFEQVKYIKPPASRSDSTELYIIAKNFNKAS
ncbi:unnamed protein product [Dimorphilus gyrociliatus]|uniref:rRNA methyltransferase 2, mitochondrial n=1 Tax=Dimorphilus gyrociliatus TaxID=2664684 RepID=A0A7I8W7J6_9ANNE|nr:unnamed protein product [Dimorphilus gyrociliatus]